MDKKNENKGKNDTVYENENKKQNIDHNGFDLSNLRLSQDFSAIAGVKKTILTIPVRKPGRQEFIRVHPSEDYYIETAVLEHKEERETYLVDRSLWTELPGEIIPKILFTVINRQNILSIWPVRLPGEDGRLNPWHQSALDAANLAQKQWVRIVANMSLGAYDIYEAVEKLPGPDWPDLEFKKILEIAFKDKFIHDSNHQVLRQLRGEL